mgnify:CR=1 FL=1
MLLPKLLPLLAATTSAKDPTATELKEYADLFRCGSVKLGDQLATVKRDAACGDSLCTQKASPRDACAKRCARTRHCGAVAYGDEECTLYRTGALNGTSNACVASFRTNERPAAGEVLHHFAPGLAYRFFSVVDLKEKVYLLARDGLWPNAAPDERLLLTLFTTPYHGSTALARPS